MKKAESRKKTADFTSCNGGRKDVGMDALIKDALQNTGTRIVASESLKQRIDFQIADRSAKEGHKMKRMNMKKVVLGVAAACVMVGTIAIAGSGVVSYMGHGSSIPDYTKFEDMGKAESEIGYSVGCVESFSNGFDMKGIHIIETVLQDESGQTLGEKKSLEITYSKGGEEMDVYCKKLLPVEEADIMEIGEYDRTLETGGITMGYTSSMYKAVPPDYEPTEEDKKAMESGRLQIGDGSAEIETSQYSRVVWVKDGIRYELMGFNVSLNADEMLQMAQEMVENGN